MNTPLCLHSWIGALALVLALGALTSSASAQASASDQVPPEGTAGPVLETALPRQDAADSAVFDPTARARELDRARASYSRLGLGGPIVLMSVSFTLAPPVILIGLVANALGGNPTLLVAGIGLGVVGIGSASWLGHRLRDRRVVGARIRALEASEPGQVSLGIRMRPERAGFSLHMTF